MSTDAFNSRFPTRGNWAPSQLKLVCSLYLQWPFGQFHTSNPRVRSLATLIGTSPSAVAMKLGNFASLDPAQGGKGQSASAQARKTWNDFHHDWTRRAWARCSGCLRGREATASPPSRG